MVEIVENRLVPNPVCGRGKLKDYAVAPASGAVSSAPVGYPVKILVLIEDEIAERAISVNAAGYKGMSVPVLVKFLFWKVM